MVLAGCLRLHGEAKAVDLLTFMQEARAHSISLRLRTDNIEEKLDAIQTTCQQLFHSTNAAARKNSVTTQPAPASPKTNEDKKAKRIPKSVTIVDDAASD